MIGHLGTRVSALLDGQLSARDAEEAWSHVYACHSCRDLVEREGWVKTRLAGLCGGPRADESSWMASPDLKGALLSMPPCDSFAAHETSASHRRAVGVVMIGGGAIGAAMLGVIAFGLNAGPGAPTDRRPPATQINTVVPSTGTPGGSGAPVRTPVRHALP